MAVLVLYEITHKIMELPGYMGLHSDRKDLFCDISLDRDLPY